MKVHNSIMKKSHTRGFGLAEILIAIALFSTAFLYLLSTLTLSNHAIKHSSDRVYAQDMAERVLELQRGKAYSALVDYQGLSQASYKQNGQTVILDFTYQVDVTEVDVAGTSRRVKNIAVRVDWINRYMPTEKARTRSVTMETAVGE
ncbi:hypothetical protein IV102_22445 [bacterium]|nr:hypothetical protein [bacterium]